MSARFPRLGLALFGTSCQPWQPLADDALCEAVAQQVSAVTHRCTGDAQLANERFQRWLDTVRCEAPGPRDSGFAAHFECVAAIGDTSCAQVLDKGDDFESWIGISEVCESFLVALKPVDDGGSGSGDGADYLRDASGNGHHLDLPDSGAILVDDCPWP